MILNKKITQILLNNKVVTSDDREIYEYGFELLLSTILGYILVITTSLILGMGVEGIVFLVVFVLIRNYTGGYHANTHFKCNSLLVITVLSVLLLSRLKIGILYLILMYIVYFLTIFIYAPVEHENKPLNDKKKKKYKLVSISISIIISIVIIFFYKIDIELVKIIILTLFSVSIYIVIAEVNKILYN